MNLWHRLFGKPKSYCPTCGLEMVTYRNQVVEGGYVEEREWTACPVWRAEVPGTNYVRHAARWRLVWRRPHQFDPDTGKPL